MLYPLPYDTNLETLLNEARGLSDLSGDLDDRKLITAQKYGFLSWRQLEQYLELPQKLPPNFEHLACLTYWYADSPKRQHQAEEIVKENPDIEYKSIHTAAAAGNVQIVEEFLDDDPKLLNHRGGYFDWEPLLYACYSRVQLDGHSTSDVVNTLLDRGANPNAHYRWGGIYLFSALTGICGEGERGPINQPQHPDYPALAERLLELGANCNDTQSLYNRMFQRDNSCLKLLLESGLNSNHHCNWYETRNRRLVKNSVKTLDYQLHWAVKKNHIERTQLLLEHGADPNQKIPGSGRLSKFSRRKGYNEIADALERHGAKPYRLKKVEKFLNHCLSNDESSAKKMLSDDPELVNKAQRRIPDAMCDAAEINLAEPIELMLKLGFNVHGSGHQTPIHQAAHNGHLDLVKRLLTAGASLSRRDPFYCSTPLGWAQAGDKTEVIEYLSSFDLGMFDLINLDALSQIEALLDTEPNRLEHPLRDEIDEELKQHEIAWQTPLAYAAIREREKVVELLLGRGAKLDITSPGGKTILDLCSPHMREQIAKHKNAN